MTLQRLCSTRRRKGSSWTGECGRSSEPVQPAAPLPVQGSRTPFSTMCLPHSRLVPLLWGQEEGLQIASGGGRSSL